MVNLRVPAHLSADQPSATEARRFARNLWLGMLVLNLFVAGFAAYATYLSWRNDVDRARTATQNLSLTLEREIAGIFDNVDLALKSLVDHYTDMHRSNTYRADDWNAALWRQRSHLPMLSGIRGTDASGAIVHGLVKGDPQGASIADRDYFIMHRDNPAAGLLISQPVFSRITQKWSLILSRRLDAGSGRFGGVVAAAVPLERIGERFSSLKIGAAGSISMRDGNLRLIFRLPASAHERAKMGATQLGEPFKAALQRDPVFGTYHNDAKSMDGIQRLHSYRRNDPHAFYINVGVADDEYFSPWRTELLLAGALVGLFLLVTVAFAHRLQRAWILQQASSAQLTRREADFRILADDAPYGVALLGADGAFAYLNSAFTRMLGYTIEDIPDLNAWHEKAFPDRGYRQRVIDTWQHLVIEAVSPETVDRTFKACRSDGVERDIRFMIVKMNDDRITMTCEDVTEQIRSETALRESKDQFTKVVENSPLSMALVSMDGTIEYINRKAIETFGYLPQDIPDMDRWWVQAYPDATYRAEVVALWMGLAGEALAHDREIEPREYRVTCKNGNVKVMSIFGVWIAEKVLVVFEDVSERRKAEQGMQLAQQIFDTASEVILVSDLRGNILDANAEACRLAKYTHEQMLCLRIADLAAEEDIQRIAAELAQCDTGAVVRNRWLMRCSDGSTVPLDLVVQRLQIGQYLAIGRDIGEREEVLGQLAKALEAAESANAAKSRFLAAASHDLRQPIQAINLFCMALANSRLSEQQKQISDYLSLSAKSLGDILNALLDISSFDAGSVKPVSAVIQVESLLRNIVAQFSPMASGKRLRFEHYCPRRSMAISTDAKLLHSLMGNLIGNAIKYSERGGILVAVRRRGQQALVQVWDTGIGIAPEHLDNIFEEYFQIGNPERDRTQGLGLGLSIAKRIARLLDTELVCRSRIGKGSVFELRLPLASELPGAVAEEVEREQTAGAAVSRSAARRIVVIDDDMAVANSIRLALESEGMSVTAYDSAEAALASPEIGDADFYISDLRLPGLNGREFLDALQQRSLKPIRAVVLTGDNSPERVALALSSPWEVLFKPVDLPKLLSAIESQDSIH